MRLSKNQKKSVSELFVNISTAWLIGGIITPWFTHQNFSDIMVIDSIAGIVFSFLFMIASWVVYK